MVKICERKEGFGLMANLLYLPEKGIFEDTLKTESSNRSITVSVNTINLLNIHRVWQMQRRLVLGDKWVENDYIFTAWNGSALHPDTISSWFRKLTQKYDLQKVSIHSLRHTNATMLIMNGLPIKAVSSRLGHSNAVTTSNIYSHALKSSDERAAEVMDGIMQYGENVTNSREKQKKA